MIEVALGVAVDPLVVADGGASHRIPVDHADTAVYHALLIKVAEGGYHSLGQLRLHSEAGTVPVAGSAEFAELLKDDAPVLLFPLPRMLEEFLAADVLLADSPLLEPGHDLGLGGDAGVIRARHPAGVLAVHARLADKHIVDGVVEHMAHVEDSRHVRRRDDYCIWFTAVRLRMEALVLRPICVPLVLDRGRVIFCFKFHRTQR